MMPDPRVALFVVALVVAGCGSDDGPGGSDRPRDADDFTSICDEHGNRVYLSEDDTQSSPGIFVLENACAAPSPPQETEP